MKKPPRKRKVSKAEWLGRALEILEREGLHGIRVDRLASDLGVSRAGFYWHFEDRQDLLQSLLDYWVNEFTSVVTENPVFLQGDPKQRLYDAMLAILERDLNKYDLAIRDWAAHDPSAAEAVESVYQQRLSFARKLFRKLGFRGKQLEMRTMLFVCYHSWEKAMFPDLPKSEKRKLLKMRHLLLITK